MKEGKKKKKRDRQSLVKRHQTGVKGMAKKVKSPFVRGEKGFEISQKWDEERKSKGRGQSRYKLQPGERGLFIILDDALVFYQEHAGQVGKQFYKKPCIGDSEMCPYCETNERKTSAWIVGTIINFTGFENNDGDRVRYFKQQLVLTGQSAKDEMMECREKIKKEVGKENPLRMTVWEARRGKNKKSVATGDRFAYKGKWSKKKLQAYLEKHKVERDDWDEFLSPLDYEELLEPETEKEARKFLGLGAPDRVGHRKDADDEYDTDDDDDEERSIEDELDSEGEDDFD
jgi:hypothetical protein